MAKFGLGNEYCNANRPADGIPLLEDAYQGIKQASMKAMVRSRLIEAYIETGKSAEAHSLIQNHLAYVQSNYQPESTEFANQLVVIGINLMDIEKWGEAELVLRDCLAIRENTRPDHFVTSNTKSMLGETLLRQEDYSAAKPLLITGFEELQQRADSIPDTAKGRITDAINRLIELARATHDDVNLEKWLKEFETMKANGGSKSTGDDDKVKQTSKQQ